MARPYEYLRMRLAEHDINYAYLAAEILHKSEAYISERMTGKRPWGQDDQYAIMDALQEPYERLHIVFPPGGRGRGKQRDIAAEARAALLESAQTLMKRANAL